MEVCYIAFWNSTDAGEDQCKFEHTRSAGNRPDNNRYAPLNGNDSRNYSSNDQRNYNNNDSRNYSSNNARGPTTDLRDRSRQQPHRDRHIDKDQLRHDLSADQPIWKLSCYSPRPDLPKQLFGGPDREFSPEEVRLRFYELAAQNRMQDAIQEAESIYQQATTQMAKVLEDIPGAIRYLVNGFHTHPNRLDICEECTRTGVYLESGSSTDNKPADSTTAVSPFAPSAISAGGPGNSLFGQSPAAASNAPFGRSGSFAQVPALGQPPGLGAQPAFGQTGFLQAPAQSVFNSSSISSATRPAFGHTPQLGAQASPFSTVSNPFSQNTNTPVVNVNPFTTQPTSEVGMQMSPSTSTPLSNPFGVSTAGSVPPQTNGGFPSSQPTIFGHPSSNTGLFGQASGASSGIFGVAQTTATPAQPPKISNGVTAQKDAQGRIQRWNGRQVQYIDDQPCYREDDGYWQRIWFPDGPPSSNKPEELPSDMPYGPEVEQNFQMASNSRQFQTGLIPLVMPKREWTNWDF